MPSILDRLKQRKLIRWALTYVAGAWGIAQVVDVVADPWGVTPMLLRGIQTALVLLFPIAVVLAWYHGEKGHQRVSKTEMAILTVLVVAGGATFVALDPMAPEAGEVVAVRDPPAPNSIVVLPFRDLSLAGDQEYMGHGIAGEVHFLLQQIPEMTVISQRTASAIWEGNSTIPQIADSLNVLHVLEGSVTTIGDSVRINASLIDPRADTLLFARRFEGSLDNFIALQDSIAATVVSALQVALLGPMPTLERTDPEAYLTFLQAKHIADRSSDNYETVLPMFEEVLTIDPDFWPALLEVAVIYLDWTGEVVVPFEEGSQRARDAIDRTLEIDPANAYALALQAGALYQFELEFEAAADLLERAHALKPNHPEVLMVIGNFYTAVGRPVEAITLFEHVRSLDPLYPINLSNLALANYLAGRYEEAARLYRSLLDLSPGHAGAQTMLAFTLVELGDPAGALAAARLETRPEWRIPGELAAFHALGRMDDFEIGIQQFAEDVGSFAPHIIGLSYAWVGEHDLAFEWLDRVPPPMSLEPEVVSWLSARDIADDPRWPAFRERVLQSEERMEAIELNVSLPGGN
jgi:adenylate cyclase